MRKKGKNEQMKGWMIRKFGELHYPANGPSLKALQDER